MARSPAKRVIGSILFVLALALLAVFYFVLFADAENIRNVPLTDEVAGLAIVATIVLGVVALVLLLLLVIRGYQKAEEESEEAEAFFVPEEEPEPEPYFEPEPEPEPEPADEGDGLQVYDIWTIPVQKRAWATSEGGMPTFYFPQNLAAGVYVNDYITLNDQGLRLKMRTLLAGPTDFSGEYYTVPAETVQENHVREAPREPSTASSRPPRPERELPGDSFMRELEGRYERRSTTTVITETQSHDSEAYYDYSGDDHPVIDVEGIGPVYAEKLNEIGIETTGRLCYEDAGRIARRIDAPRKTVESWQAMAEMMKVNGIGKQYAEALARAGISGIEELKRRSASTIADQVNGYLAGLDSNVLGSKITERRVEGWKEAARPMRRRRMAVPEA